MQNKEISSAVERISAPLPSSNNEYEAYGPEELLMVPKRALVIYGQRNGPDHTLEMFEIREGRLINPFPLTNDNMNELCSVLENSRTKENTLSGWTRDVVFLGQYHMFFHVKAGVRLLALPKDDNKQDMVDRVKKCWIPRMLVRYQGPAHDVHLWWAVPGGKYIPAPMPNVFSGHLCLGSSMAHYRYSSEIPYMIRLVMAAFWSSRFTEWRNCRPIMQRTQKAVEKGAEWFWQGKGEGSKELKALLKNAVDIKTIIDR